MPSGQTEAVPLAEPAADSLPAAACLELTLHPDDAEHFARQSEIARMRSGRVRSSSVRLVWADTQDGRLAADGLSLCERRSGRAAQWRLERMRGTPDAPWPPGTPAPLVAEAAALTDLGPQCPAALVPIAACDGMVRTYALGEAQGGVALTMLSATLRAVAHERPICRVWLSGAPGDIAALALTLAQSARLTVPAASLAAEAMAHAGHTVAPRSLGAPALPRAATVSAAFAALAGHLCDVILHWSPMAAAQTTPEAVHQMRVALRRLRSALSLFARAVGHAGGEDLNRSLRNLQKALGPARDWDVFLGGIGQAVAAALPDDRPVAKLVAAAERQRQDAYAELRQFLDSAAFRTLAIRLACVAAFRPWEWANEAAPDEAQAKRRDLQDAPVRDFATHVLDRRLSRVAAAGEDLTGLSAADLHGLRIQCKKMRYAAEFFSILYSARASRRFLRRIAALQDRLGRLNDAAVAADLMSVLGGGGDRGYAVGVVRGFIAAGQRGARGKAERAWRKFRRVNAFWA